MKTLLRFLFLISVVVFSSQSFAQISNLLVNGSSTNFTMVSGSEISWSYDLPVGGTALLEIWVDVNSNMFIEPLIDVLWQSFYQIDGQQNQDGPPDTDGLVNGHIEFSSPVGLAPSSYIMSFSNNNVSVTIPGTVTPLLSPTFIISGQVTVPAGKSAQYIMLSMNSDDENGGGIFWNALTDASGNFSVQMDSDTTGNPWKLELDNELTLSPAILVPDRILIVLDAGVKTTYAGNNFTFLEAAAEVNGTVSDDGGNPLIYADVFISGNDGSWSRNTRTDLTGSYRLGFLANELPAANVWLGSGNSEDNSIVAAGFQLPTVNPGNVITKNLVVYSTNSAISGTVTLSGNPPNMNLEIFASVADTGFVRTWTDYNGNYNLNVSNKLFNYMIGIGQLPPGYMPYSVLAHPGQSNVNLNFNLTDVHQDQSFIPSEFSLSQNYPNPFNPVTNIKFGIPKASRVTLNVYNLLGQLIASLINEDKEVGYHEVKFSALGRSTSGGNAINLSNGVYIFRLTAGDFIQSKKMTLIK